MKRLIGRLDTDPAVHASINLPFLVQTIDTGVGPLIAALLNNVWRSINFEAVLAFLLGELRVLTVPVSGPIKKSNNSNEHQNSSI